jgi:hypothetical protein
MKDGKDDKEHTAQPTNIGVFWKNNSPSKLFVPYTNAVAYTKRNHKPTKRLSFPRAGFSTDSQWANKHQARYLPLSQYDFWATTFVIIAGLGVTPDSGVKCVRARQAKWNLHLARTGEAMPTCQTMTASFTKHNCIVCTSTTPFSTR